MKPLAREFPETPPIIQIVRAGTTPTRDSTIFPHISPGYKMRCPANQTVAMRVWVGCMWGSKRLRPAPPPGGYPPPGRNITNGLMAQSTDIAQLAPQSG